MLDLLGPAALLSADVAPAARFFAALAACVAVLALLAGLAAAHRRRLRAIPIRIHVAGTRGKSSTVRLIAGAFRAAGHRVVAKTTGTDPRLILPDGSERPVRRLGAATIAEQRAFVAAARRAGAEVIVAEAMAIQPEYLHALEHGYIRATDLVIANAYPDHQEDLGTAPDAMAAALAQALPPGRRVFLGPDARQPPILSRAAALGCEVVNVEPDGDPLALDRALARAVAARYGLPAAAVDEAVRAAARDPGAFTLAALDLGPLAVPFANAFSCNDATSFERLWRAHQPPEKQAAFLLNPRSDRPLRTQEFLALLARLAPQATLFIAARNPVLRRLAVANGFAPKQVHLIGARLGSAQLRAMAQRLTAQTLLWGVGNYKGAGARLTAQLRHAA